MKNSKKLAITSVVTHKASDHHEKQWFVYNTQFHSKKIQSTMYFGSGPVLAEQVLQFSVPGLVAVASWHSLVQGPVPTEIACVSLITRNQTWKTQNWPTLV